MPLSKAQLSLHWRKWAKACDVQGWNHCDAEKKDLARHSAYTLALGRDKSLTAFSNADFDRVLAVFDTLIDPLNIDAQIKVRLFEDGNDPGLRARLEWAIFNSGFPPAYIEKIALDKFGILKVKELTIPQLEQLRLTLKSRARARDRKAEQNPAYVQAKDALKKVCDERDAADISSDSEADEWERKVDTAVYRLRLVCSENHIPFPSNPQPNSENLF